MAPIIVGLAAALGPTAPISARSTKTRRLGVFSPAPVRGDDACSLGLDEGGDDSPVNSLLPDLLMPTVAYRVEGARRAEEMDARFLFERPSVPR